MIVWTIITPFFFAIVSLALWNYPRLKRLIAIVGALIIAVFALATLFYVQRSGIQPVQIGSWRAPFGITLVIDLFSAIMLAITGVIALIISCYSQTQIDLQRVKYGFYPLFFFLLMGVNGAFSAGDLFNLYVWFEVMLMSSFVLIALGGERPQIEGAVKYVILNLFSSILFLSAIGLLYNLVGTLNLADLSRHLPQIEPQGQVSVIAVLFIVAFGIKAAVFPLFFWLPASYHTPPITVTALFSGLLTKVGVYALIRVFTLLFVEDTAYTHTILLALAGFTMTTGVLGAVAQTDFRRLLSFHMVSQIGYLLMGLGLYTQESLAASLYFMIHVILAKTALFLVCGVVYQMSGSFDLKKLGGLYKARPAVSLLFLFPALSLAGLPPLSGFFAKLSLIAASFTIQQYLIAAVGLAVSFFTLYSMIKVWTEAFWKEKKPAVGGEAIQPVSAWMWAPTLAIVVLSTLVGFLAEPVFNLCRVTAAQLFDPTAYVTAVFGGLP